MTFIPVLSTQAGACLTAANWSESATKIVCFELAALLFKPGYEVLSSLPRLAEYIAWKQTLVLDASLKAKNESYSLRSPYDGSTLSYNLETLVSLIISLKPNVVILPVGARIDLPEPIISFFPRTETMTPDDEQRVYLHYRKQQSWTEFLALLAQCKRCSIYVAGEFDCEEIRILKQEGVDYIQSDLPAANGMQGIVYTGGHSINLLDSQYAEDFTLIDQQCSCVTCEQNLTRAYLHHLLLQTPLLCQRFLIQHNIHYCQTL